MMKEFVNKLSYEELEKLELLVSDAKMKKDKDFVAELMNNAVNALDKAKTELNKRYENKYYITFEINGNVYYLDENMEISVIIENKDDECDTETLYYEVI